MLRWMRRWLLARDDAPTEDDFAISSDASLRCTRSGQVLGELHGKSVFDLNAERESELAGVRSEFGRTHGKSELLGEVRRLIALPAPIVTAHREDVGETKRAGYSARKLVFTTEPGIVVPALLFRSEKTKEARGPLVVVIGDDLREAPDPGGPAGEWLERGAPVLVADLRGMGSTAPEAKPGPFGLDMKEAFLSMHLARPLLGQRVGDLLALLASLAGEFPDGFVLVGKGTAGPIALHAAALEPRVISLTLDGSITSWSAVVRTPVTRDQLSNVVPGVLAVYDLPDLAASLVPRKLIIRGAVDPNGRPLSSEEMEIAYASCRRAYRAEAAEQGLSFRTGPAHR